MQHSTSQDEIVKSAVSDTQSITSDWQEIQDLIDGVIVREVKNVCKRSGGVLTELYRRDWFADDSVVDQVFQNVLEPGQVSAWHMHRETSDRLFVNRGALKIVLFDGRIDSPTCRAVNEFCFGQSRPALIVIPPGVWHGVKNLGSSLASLINMVDRAYRYDSPDHWRVPPDSDEIPYRL